MMNRHIRSMAAWRSTSKAAMQGRQIGAGSRETATRQDADLDLRYVERTAALEHTGVSLAAMRHCPQGAALVVGWRYGRA